MQIADDVIRFSADPEYYTDAKSCTGVPSFILMQAYESARRTYYSCGGHYRAWRMEKAMKSIANELKGRDIVPLYEVNNAIDVGRWAVRHG